MEHLPQEEVQVYYVIMVSSGIPVQGFGFFPTIKAEWSEKSPERRWLLWKNVKEVGGGGKVIWVSEAF